MKRRAVLTASLLAAGLCAAQEEGLVISSTPVVQQVAVPRQVCSSEPVTVQPPRSGAGAALGAIAGGIVGNAAGNGSGAATVLGAIGGAVIGDRIEQPPPAQVQSLQHCGVQTYYENRTVGYEVEYEYGGRRHRAQLPYDPGQTIALRVEPADLGEPGAPPPQPVIAVPPVYLPPVYAPPVVMVPPSAPAYYVRPYPYYVYPPVGVQLRLGIGAHPHRHHRHRHRH